MLIADAIYPQNGGELYFGFVSPLGTRVQPIIDEFVKCLSGRTYQISQIKLSDLIRLYDITGSVDLTTDYKRIDTLQEAGNKLREQYGHDCMAMLSCARVAQLRAENQEKENVKPQRCAYFFQSIKHPAEAELFRTIYGHGFFLVAIHSTYESRLRSLAANMRERDAKRLIEKDEKETEDFGQNTREAFELADFYLKDDGDVAGQVARFVDLIFGALYTSPTKNEYGMYIANCASQRSIDLSRQVGSAILDDNGDLLAAGCNEVPRAGGGSYWPEDSIDIRDYALGGDPNDAEKQKRFAKLRSSLQKQRIQINEKQLNNALTASGLKDITEFGRTVHAEMDSIMSCARRGISVKNSTLYCTTFPCHNCARHIIAAGIMEVVYIEPYAKSEAYSLHSDSLSCEAIPPPQQTMPKLEKRVRFLPFEGVAPRRFSDFFSMRHITGTRIERKEKGTGKVIPQNMEDLRTPRLRLSSFSYLQREEFAVKYVSEIVQVGVKSDEEDIDE